MYSTSTMESESHTSSNTKQLHVSMDIQKECVVCGTCTSDFYCSKECSMIDADHMDAIEAFVDFFNLD